MTQSHCNDENDKKMSDDNVLNVIAKHLKDKNGKPD